MGMIFLTVKQENLGSVVEKLSVNFGTSQGSSIHFQRISVTGEPAVFKVVFDNVLRAGNVMDSLYAENLIENVEHTFGI